MNRNNLVVFIMVIISSTCFSQGGTWVWVKGSNTPNASAIYGNKGVPASNNTPQGLCGSAYWPDMHGNFWVFGGFDGGLNVTCAMWRYSPASNEWTWMSGKDSLQVQGVQGPGAPHYGTRGVAGATNFPGARVWATQWTDNNGNLWLFGGSGWDSTGYPGVYNDLWEYNTTTNLWMWVSGSNEMNASDVYGTFQTPSDTTVPGARYSAGSSWVDANNNLWFFGGVESNTSFNDMWRYNISTNQWTWMNGPQGGGNAGNYGSIGVESSTNVPPHRTAFSRWKDACGNFYLWGGGDYWIGEISNQNRYSDVWKYDVSTNYWVWVAGENTGGSLGSYNQYCTNNGITGPQARTFNSTPQVLQSTNAFIGYAGNCTTNGHVGLDDLWLFNSATNEWKWIGGRQGTDISATYGLQGVPSASNLPGSRYETCTWVDSSGTFWMFGGEGDTALHMFNDVWKFIPDTSCTGVLLVNGTEEKYHLSATNICNGGHVTLSLTGISNASVSPPTSVIWQDTADAILSPAVTTTYTLTGQTSCAGSDTILFTIQVAPISAQIVANPSVFCTNDSTSICTTTSFATYAWNNGDTTMCIETKDTGAYYVTVSDISGCTATSNQVVVSYYQHGSGNISQHGDSLIADFIGAAGFQWYYNNQPLTGDTTIAILAQQPGDYYVEVTDRNGCPFPSNTITTVTGIDNLISTNLVKLYPNPNTGNFTLEFTDDEVRKVEITDLLGRVVVAPQTGERQMHFSLNELSSGDYFLRVIQNTHVEALIFSVVK